MTIFITCGVNLGSKNAQTTHLIEIASNFTKLGHTIYLFAPFTGRYQGKVDFKIIYIPILELKWLRMVIYQLLLPLYFLYYNFSVKPDFYYTRFGNMLLVPSFMAKIFGTPHVTEVNGLNVDEMMMSRRSQFMICCVKFTERIVFSLSNKIVTVTVGIKNELHERYGISFNKMVVISNGVNTDIFKPIRNAKVQLGFSTKFKYIGFVGLLARWQGVEYLIKAAPLIILREPLVRFIIVGDGPDRESLENLAEKFGVDGKFIFTGQVDYKKVPYYINTFDICTLLKKNLASGYSPLKLYEYLACGRPVISSNEPGIGDFITNNHCGVTVNITSVAEIVDEVVNLLGNTELGNKMGANGLKIVREKNSWLTVAKKIEKILI